MRRRTFLLAGLLAAGGGWWWQARWRYIVVHHSGGTSGDLDFLRRVHRERQARDPIDMIPYHFVIGNGRGMGLGETLPTRRWTYALWGAHVRGRDRNFRGIGICLIGNFEEREVPEAQYLALLDLTRTLMRRHRIEAANVSLHGQTPGERTRCPGRNFPAARFFDEIATGA